MMRSLLKATTRVLCVAALAVFVTAMASSPADAQIQRWTDAQGKVHYGDSPPPEASKDVKTLPKAAQLSSEEEAQARAASQGYRNSLRSPPPQSTVYESGFRSRRPNAAADSSCAAQWERYKVASSCFGSCRVARGGINSECAANCQPMTQPSCARP